MARIAIIGGGLSGLSTAYELTRRGCTDFVLYESSPRLGGIVETHRHDGFVIECGADSWVTEKPWARDLAIELGLEDQIIPSNDAHRRTYLLEDNKLIPMPNGMRMMVPTDLDAIDRSPLFTESARQAYSEEPSRAEELKAFAASRPADWDESVASFVQRHFGEEVAEKIAGPLLAGVFGGDIHKLSAPAVMAPFVKMEREHGSLILALQRQSRSSGLPRSVFTSMKNGLQSLVDAMAATIPPSQVRLNEAVANLTPKGGKWEIVTASSSSIFDQIVIATPAHTASQLIAPWQPELGSLLDIEASSAIIAAFAFDREESKKITIPVGFGFLAPQHAQPANSEPQLLACTFVDQKFSHRAPEGCVVLRAFYGGNSAPLLLDKQDDVILNLARSQLSPIFGEVSQPKIHLVRRWPRSLPQYAIGHLARVERIEAILSQIPGLHVIGNTLHGVGLPNMVHQGRAAGARMLNT